MNEQISQTNQTSQSQRIISTGNASYDAGIRVGYSIGYNQALEDFKEIDDSFTQAELQFLKAYFQGCLEFLHHREKVVNCYIKYIFDRCNPDDPDSLIKFKTLNISRDQLRSVKSKVKTLSGIQKKVKKAMSK